jgi:aromatic ring-opening dioxygenase LigB subunit
MERGVSSETLVFISPHGVTLGNGIIIILLIKNYTKKYKNPEKMTGK